ncbi:MAG: cyclic nucleotide-binding domain-containing protein [Collimonas sp.]|uniref:cyclic nucleotide-binding domain-containing protein n=1 Tax=Burkholderiales TaxID=80840 RepID=UPI003263F7AD
MFKNLIDGIKTQLSRAPELLEHDERMRSVRHSGSASRAAELLIAPTAFMQLSPAEALAIVSYMTPRRIPMDTTFIHEGDKTETGYMLLLLEGEVTVENIVVSRVDPVTVNVLGPGSLIGELGLIDGQARLASCTASTDVTCAILSRAALEKLSQDDPQTAAKLLLAMSMRIADRLRDTTEKVKRYSQLVQAMQQEIDHMMPS